MNHGIRTVIYPVKDIDRAKSFYETLLEVEPNTVQESYVGFRIGNEEIGLDPNGHESGMTTYYHVDDIAETLQSLVDAGAEVQQDIKDVGGGRSIAIVKDADGNIIGLLQEC